MEAGGRGRGALNLGEKKKKKNPFKDLLFSSGHLCLKFGVFFSLEKLKKERRGRREA